MHKKKATKSDLRTRYIKRRLRNSPEKKLPTLSLTPFSDCIDAFILVDFQKVKQKNGNAIY